MTRTMWDTISASIADIPSTATMVAGYDTGSSDILWTSSDWSKFNDAVRVHIDQAGPGAPTYSSTVMDVEPGCYSPSDVPNWTSKCTAARPTVYCDQSDLPSVMAVWKGAIWLAAPGMSDANAVALAASNTQIVAVQNVQAGTYDQSVVIDEYWPEVKPVATTPTHATITVPPPGKWLGGVFTGIGTTGDLWYTTYNAETGEWSAPVQGPYAA